MSEALQTFSYHAQMMDIQRKPKSVNYMIPIAEGVAMELERGNDFGVIPGTKKPSLYKAGAEKICMSLGLSQQYELVSHIEDPENGFFSYTVRCALVKIVNGQEYTIVSSYGSANTREKRCGTQSAFDGMNSALKMAQKRALVGAAIVVGGLSNLFSQDIESEDYLSEGMSAYGTGKGTVTPAQIKMFYTVSSRAGLTKSDAKAFLKAHNYNSAKEILQSDFESLLEALRKIGEGE